jgi:hypothetical protein
MAMVVIVLAGLAVVLAVVRGVQLMPISRIDAAALAQQLGKLVRADNIERALKLCEAIETAATGMMGSALREYQRAGVAAAEGGLEGARGEWAGKLARGRTVAFAALAADLACGVAAVVAPNAGGVPPGRGLLGPTMVVAGLAGGLVVWSLIKERDVIAKIVVAWRRELLPALQALSARPPQRE